MIKIDDLINLIENALELDESNNKIDLNSSSENIEEWDSLGHLSIISALDKFTEGKTADIDFTDSNSVNKIIAQLKKNKLF